MIARAAAGRRIVLAAILSAPLAVAACGDTYTELDDDDAGADLCPDLAPGGATITLSGGDSSTIGFGDPTCAFGAGDSWTISYAGDGWSLVVQAQGLTEGALVTDDVTVSLDDGAGSTWSTPEGQGTVGTIEASYLEVPDRLCAEWTTNPLTSDSGGAFVTLSPQPVPARCAP